MIQKTKAITSDHEFMLFIFVMAMVAHGCGAYLVCLCKFVVVVLLRVEFSILRMARYFFDAYGTYMDVNVIAIDWDKLASIDFYPGAAVNSIRVGKHVGEIHVFDILMNAF